MESGSSTDDDDYEAYLYSLLHHSGDNILEERDILSGSPSSERMSVEQSGSSEVITPFYQSKRNKVSRLDMVKTLTDASYVPPDSGRTATLSTNTKNKRIIKTGQKQEVQNNYYSLLHSYKEARSSCMQSAPAKEPIFQSTYAEYRYRKGIQKGKAFSRALNAEGRNSTNTSSPIIIESSVQGRNRVTISNSFFQNSVVRSATENYHTSVPRNTFPYFSSSADNGCFNNYGHKENNCSKSQNSSHENMYNDADRNKNRKYDIRNEMRDENRHDHLEGELSKYDLCLNKDKQNSKEEPIIDLDSSDSDGESVVEVEAPLRKLPPVVSLSSDEETPKSVSDEKRLKNVSIEEDIVVLYTSGKSNVSAVLPTATDSNILNKSVESVESCDTVLLNNTSATRKDSEKNIRKRKKKKRKENKRAENGRHLERSLNSVFQTSPSISSFISPKSWSEDMSHFYNDSWGGETFDVHRLQLLMSDDPARWKVLYSDIVSTPPRRSQDQHKKCYNCNMWGHAAKSCPDPQKPIVCLFCGKTGHFKRRCPTTICLRCGTSTKVYKDGCLVCLSSKKSYKLCNTCNDVGHSPSECPETWRRYHSTTTSKDLSAVSSRTLYKPREEQFCCNCARRGHQSHECRSADNAYTAFHNSLKRRHPREQNKMPAKRRKHNNCAAKCSFNLYFQPYY